MTTPNTNPSDLDRAARNLDDKIMDFCTFMEDDLETARFDGIVVPALNQLRAALRSRASGVPEAEAVSFTYRNWRGEVSMRNVKPISVRYGSTEWHPRPQWLLLAFDCDKQAEREFALEDIGASYPPIASEPKDAGSGEGQELTQQEQYNALHAAWSNGLLPISSTLYALNAAGYRITRTAPSGAKPGEVAEDD